MMRWDSSGRQHTSFGCSEQHLVSSMLHAGCTFKVKLSFCRILTVRISPFFAVASIGLVGSQAQVRLSLIFDFCHDIPCSVVYLASFGAVRNGAFGYSLDCCQSVAKLDKTIALPGTEAVAPDCQILRYVFSFEIVSTKENTSSASCNCLAFTVKATHPPLRAWCGSLQQGGSK